MSKRSTQKARIKNPAIHYDTPHDLVKDKELSRKEKKAALNTWKQDSRQLLTASNEGMPSNEEGVGKDDDLKLDEVERAKEQIGNKSKNKPTR